MSGSNEVERLARVLCTVVYRLNWDEPYMTDSRRDVIREEALALLTHGVTLSAPVAPRRTPVQDASDALSVRAEAFGRMLTDAECEAYARAVLAAAVGALPEGELPGHVDFGHNPVSIPRAALLAALTEGGEG